MNRTDASLTQWAGQLTMLIAFVFLIWRGADRASESDNPAFARTRNETGMVPVSDQVLKREALAE